MPSCWNSAEIVIIDKVGKARGEAMDLSHGASFVSPVNVYAGDYADCRDADIILITAGAPQVAGNPPGTVKRTTR